MRALIIFFLIAVLLTQVQAQQENLVVNGDFEQPLTVGWGIFGLTDVTLGSSTIGGSATSAFLTGSWTPYGHYGGIQTAPITFQSGSRYLVRFNYQTMASGGFYVVLSAPFRRQQGGIWQNDYIVECCKTSSSALILPTETFEFEVQAPSVGTSTFQARLSFMAMAENAKIQLDNVQIYCLSNCMHVPTSTPTIPPTPFPTPNYPYTPMPTNVPVTGGGNYSCGAYTCGQVPVPQLPPLIPPTRISPNWGDGVGNGGGDGGHQPGQGGSGTGDGSLGFGIGGMCDGDMECISVPSEERFIVDGVDEWVDGLGEVFSTDTITVIGGDRTSAVSADDLDAILSNSNLFSYIRGLYTGSYFGPFQSTINVLLFMFPIYILLVSLQFILPLMGVIIGVIRKTLDLIGQYIPFT